VRRNWFSDFDLNGCIGCVMSQKDSYVATRLIFWFFCINALNIDNSVDGISQVIILDINLSLVPKISLSMIFGLSDVMHIYFQYFKF
jgi:hypothetical protein